MHVRTLLSAFNIAPGEGPLVALLLSHSFFAGLAEVLFYTAASAVFLAAFAPTMLPYVYIGSAALSPYVDLSIEASGTAADGTAPPSDTGLAGALCGLLAPRPLADQCRVARFSSLFWLRVLAVLNNLVFSGMAERLFNVRQGKRLFSLIGSGDLAGPVSSVALLPLWWSRSLGRITCCWARPSVSSPAWGFSSSHCVCVRHR